MKTLGFIGGGRITRILLNGFKNANVSFEKIYVYETNETVLSALKADFPKIDASSTDSVRAASSAWVFIALHPPVLMDSLNAIKNVINKDALVVSFAPKITLDKMQTVLPDVSKSCPYEPECRDLCQQGI